MAENAPQWPTSDATGRTPTLYEYRTAELFGVITDRHTGQRQVCTLYLDRDLDGSWNVHAAPNWRKDVLDDDDDATGYHRTDEHTAATLLEATWDSLLAPLLRLLVVTPFFDDQFDDLWEPYCASWHRKWARRTAGGTWMAADGWKSVDEIAADPGGWSLVANHTDMMAGFPGYDAIIMCMGRFYLAVVEGGAS